MKTEEPRPGRPGHPVACYLLATRPPFLLVTLIAVGIGIATAYHSAESLHPLAAFLTLLGALLAHAGANVLNDYYDALSGCDDHNHERLYPFTGGSRFIQNGLLTPRQTLRFGLLLLLATALIGLALLPYAGPLLLALGCTGLLLGWAYSAPPLALNSRGLGELTIAIAFGPLLVVGSDLVQRGTLHPLPLYASLAYGLLTAALLYINQFPDRRADALSGKHHWVVRLGPHRARWGYLLLTLLANLILLLLVATQQLPALALLALLSLPLSLLAARDLLQYADQPAHLCRAIPLTILALSSHGVLLILALSVGG